MRITLGSQHHDLGTRALVLGSLPMAAAASSTGAGPADDLLAAADGLVRAGADLLIVPDGEDPASAGQVLQRLKDRFDVPIAVRVHGDRRGPDVAAALVRSGAAMVVGLRPEADAGCLATLTDSEVLLVLDVGTGSIGAAAAAIGAVEAAGLARRRIGLEVAAAHHAPTTTEALGPADRLVALRCPVLVSLAPWDDDPVEAATAASLAVLNGRRLICTRQVTAVRRACDVVSAVLEAER